MWRYLLSDKFDGTKIINMYNEISDQIEVITVYFYKDGQVKLINQDDLVVNPKHCYPLDDINSYLISPRSNCIFGNQI